jgi:hypothetical protein
VIYLAKEEEEEPHSEVSLLNLHQIVPNRLSRLMAKKARGKSLFVSLPSVWVDPGKSCK